MKYKIQYTKPYNNLYNTGVYLLFEKVTVYINFERRIGRLDITINKNNKVSRKKIDLSEIFKSIIDFINTNHEYIKSENDFSIDMLKCFNVKSIKISDLKIEKKDLDIIKNAFPNLKLYESQKCTYYKDCNIGILKCDIYDELSDIYSFDMFDGFKGRYLKLKNSNIKRMNKNVLHLDNQILILNSINIDYEYFFLTTCANKLRKLCIYNYAHYKKLNDLDLLFISGFYNLELLEIDATLTNYKQIEKLEKLRKIDRIYILADNPYKRLMIQNKYQEFFHKLYVDRLERVIWEDKIMHKTNEEIKNELLKIFKMNSFEKNQISRQKEKEYTFFEQIHDLDFDYTRQEEDDVLINSKPFCNGGIDYYVKRKKLILDKWGSTYKKRK